MHHGREEVRVPGLAPPLSHYTDAVWAGDLLFVSGVPALDGAGRLVGPGDVVAQFGQILENLQAILMAVGLTSAAVIKVNLYLTNVADRPLINPQRIAFFGEVRPASTLVGVAELPVPGMLVEMEAVAYLPGRIGALHAEGSTI
ncbi:MAG: RidA family protein [Thermoleophilia bacterium]|nr:RidA family protein [Thermoleophilia bacterium]